MTPAERVVVRTAIEFINAPRPCPDEFQNLGEAVAALEAERAAGGRVVTETIRTWSEVVEGDEIFSVKTRKWYEVTESGAMPEGRWKIVAKGLPKPIRPVAAGDVTVRRGETGAVVDMFASVLWSGPTLPSQPTSGPAPVEIPDAAHDPEASESDA